MHQSRSRHYLALLKLSSLLPFSNTLFLTPGLCPDATLLLIISDIITFSDLGTPSILNLPSNNSRLLSSFFKFAWFFLSSLEILLSSVMFNVLSFWCSELRFALPFLNGEDEPLVENLMAPSILIRSIDFLGKFLRSSKLGDWVFSSPRFELLLVTL